MAEQNTMTPLLIRIRRIMVSFGDLPSVDADPSTGLSNGEILTRLKEIDPHPQIEDDKPPAEGQVE